MERIRIKKQESSGQTIIDAVRQRGVQAPMKMGLAVQMQCHFWSKLLTDTLSAICGCSLHSEVRRFEENAASSVAFDILGTCVFDSSDGMLLFAADIVHHNTVSLNGKGTFLGKRMIADMVLYQANKSNKIPLLVPDDLIHSINVL